MGCTNCSCGLFLQMIASLFIILLSIVIIPAYLIVFILPVMVLIFILRLCGCKACVPTMFDFYLYYVFWPWTSYLCSIKMPFIRYKHGYKVLYLGKIKRNHLENNYRNIQKNNIYFIDVEYLNNALDLNNSDIIRIICISDTHGRHSWFNSLIPNGHILIHGGDITFQGRGGIKSLKSFSKWMKQFKHKYKIVIGGNHDRFMPNMEYIPLKDNIFKDIIYLDNNMHIIKEYNNLRIFGCGWSPYGGSGNHAFQDINKNDVNNLESNINDNGTIDILLGHSDMTSLTKYNKNNKQINDMYKLIKKCNACIHLCGHFHARYGVKIRQSFYNDGSDMMVVNCSSLDGLYIPTHCPVVFDVEL